MLKIFQARLQQYVNPELPDVQAGCTICTRKGRGTRNQIANIHWIIEKARQTSTSLTSVKPLSVWITANYGKFLKRWELDRLSCLPRNLNAVQETTDRTEHGKMDWFQIGKGVHQGCILSPCLFTYVQSTSCEMPDWMKHKLESRLPGGISITSICNDTTLMAESEE